MRIEHIHVEAIWCHDQTADLDVWCGLCAWRHTWQAPPGGADDGSATLADLVALVEAHECSPAASS